MSLNFPSWQSLASRTGHVAILLCTYQGEKYLTRQLDSLGAQTHEDWSLWVSDDGSVDHTWEILHRYQRKWGRQRVHLLRGPGKGFAANFLSLLCNTELEADFFAYADQDDIWHDDKLSRSLSALEESSDQCPALYTSRTLLIDGNDRLLGISARNSRPPGFANALVQNIASGNTMVINGAGRDMIRRAGPRVDIDMHDWWTYLLIAGCGGRVIHDPTPTVRYRQHGNNQIGMALGWRSYVKRVRLLWAGRHRQHVQRNLDALVPFQAWLTPANQHRLHVFAESRGDWLLPRLVGLWRSGVYRQSLLGTLGMLVATILNKT